MKALTPGEFNQLKDRFETGDPLKDWYDEVDLIGRLIATIERKNAMIHKLRNTP